MLRATLRALSLLSLLLCLSLAARANIIHVPTDQPTLTAALSIVADGDTILLADGVYSEGGPVWVEDKGVTIQSESDNPGACILDETMLGFGMTYNQTRTLLFRGITFRNGWDAPITLENDIVGEPVLTGYDLTVCNCLFADNGYPGIRVGDPKAMLTLTRCTFKDSGGIYNAPNCLLSNCAFTNSRISGSYVSYFSAARCTFTNSSLSLTSMPDDTGNLSITVTDCKFDRAQSGTGIRVTNFAAPSIPCLINNCAFTNNSCATATVRNIRGAMRVNNCVFANNTSANNSGAISNFEGELTITNSVFVHNTGLWGGAVADDSGRTTLLNCTFAYNQADEGGAVYYTDDGQHSGSGLRIANSLFWNNTAPLGPQIQNTGSLSAQIQNSLIQDDPGLTATPDAKGNFTADPLFVRHPSPGPDSQWGTSDDDFGDLHLQVGSPCRNAGLDSAIPAGITTDLDGNPRLVGPHVDLGAYEYRNQTPIAHDDIVSAVKNTALIISVLANDTDPENDPLAIQSTTPASHGQVTINSDGTITYRPTGNYLGADTFTYTITDGHGNQSTATVYVNVALQTSVLVTNASCVGTGSVALYARLVQGTTAGKNNLIAGQPLIFLVNGVPVGTGITDAYGKAYVNYLPVAAGSFPITVQFTGSGTYAPSEGTGTLTVTPSATEITVQPTGGQAGGGTTITGRLARTSTNKGLMGVSVTVSVDGTVVGTVTTGTDGVFTCPYSIPAGATSGAHTMTVSFAGNALNSPSTGSATLTVIP